MDNLLAGAELLARWDVILALFVGSIGGVVIGAIPGVGPAVAIAILLPATFSLDPIVGLTILLGIYGSSMYGGAIPAVLINTPGTAVNALTSYDGYPMTVPSRIIGNNSCYPCPSGPNFCGWFFGDVWDFSSNSRP